MHPDRGAVTKHVARQAAGWQPAVATMIMTCPEPGCSDGSNRMLPNGPQRLERSFCANHGAVTGSPQCARTGSQKWPTQCCPTPGAVTSHIMWPQSRCGMAEHEQCAPECPKCGPHQSARTACPLITTAMWPNRLRAGSPQWARTCQNAQQAAQPRLPPKAAITDAGWRPAVARTMPECPTICPTHAPNDRQSRGAGWQPAVARTCQNAQQCCPTPGAPNDRNHGAGWQPAVARTCQNAQQCCPDPGAPNEACGQSRLRAGSPQWLQ